MPQKDDLVRQVTLIMQHQKHVRGTLHPEPNFTGYRTEFWGCPGKAATNWMPTPVITILARNIKSSN